MPSPEVLWLQGDSQQRARTTGSSTDYANCLLWKLLGPIWFVCFEVSGSNQLNFCLFDIRNQSWKHELELQWVYPNKTFLMSYIYKDRISQHPSLEESHVAYSEYSEVQTFIFFITSPVPGWVRTSTGLRNKTKKQTMVFSDTLHFNFTLVDLNGPLRNNG